MSAANRSGPNGPVLAVFLRRVGAPPQVKKFQHAPPPWRKTTRSGPVPQLIASPVVLVVNWYAAGVGIAASVQNASGNGTQVQSAAPGIGVASERAIAAPRGGFPA